MRRIDVIGTKGAGATVLPLGLKIGLGVGLGLLTGCSGTVGEGWTGGAGTNPPGTDPTKGPVIDPKAPPADPNAAGPAPLRRLTQEEYAYTLGDLFPEMTVHSVHDDPTGQHGFSQAPLVSTDTAQTLLERSEALAAQGANGWNKLVPCETASQGEDTCAERFIDRFGRRLYRRPLEATEKSDLLSLYNKAKTDLGYGLKDRIRLVLTAMLQSPAFLYLWDQGTPSRLEGDLVKLSPFALASRLSYFLWSSGPDEALLDAAARGDLDTDGGLATQVDRMLSNPKISRTVESFHMQWLELHRVPGLSKDPVLYPQFNDGLKRDMLEETRRFVEYVFTEGDGRLSTLLGSNISFINGALANLYGVGGVGDAFQRVTLNSGERSGLLTQASVLASVSNPGGSNPARSGHMLYTRLLCGHMQPAPPGATALFVHDSKKSTRENFATLEDNRDCSGCHRLINPLGYAFEQYDAIGRFRTMEGNHPVDASGVLKTSAGERPFAHMADLATLFADDPDVQSCIARKWFRFALSRMETEADRHSLQTAFGAFQTAGFDVRVFLRHIATSRTFRYRSPETGEVL